MNARKIAVLLFALVLCTVMEAAGAEGRDLRPELEIGRGVAEIAIAPSGDLWIPTSLGRLFRSDDAGATWAEVAVPTRKMKLPESFISDHLDRIHFFDARRAMISGYIGKNSDVVLLSGDGGATWRPVSLPVSLWTYDAQTTGDGHAWLVGSNGDVLRSDDFGETWRALTRPFAKSERTMSVWFETPERGAVAAIFSGEIALTSDGGKSWQRFEAAGVDEVVRGCEGAHDKRVTKVRIVAGGAEADRLIVEQCGGVFASPLEAPRAWTRLAANGKPLVLFDVRNGNVVGVDTEANVVELAPDGIAHTRHRLERLPTAIATSGDRVAILDPTRKVTRFDGEAWASSRLFGKGLATSWPLVTADRGEQDVLWGTSEFFLYRSTDGAKTWDRIVELPSAANRLLIQRDGNVLLSNEHGWVGRWDAGTRKIVDVPVLNGLDISGHFRRADLWLVYGGRRYDTAKRVEVAQTFVSGEFAGSADHGFTAASTDGGTTWTIVDRWDEGPQAAFLSDDHRLTLLSWLGGVRQGALTREPLGAKMQTLLRGEDRDHVPYVQRTYALNLLDPKRGSLVGWIHHIDTVAWQTSNGGRTWKQADPKQHPFFALERLFDGTWLAFEPPATLRRWNGKKFEPFATTPDQVRRLWVDSRGDLAVLLADQSLHVLDAGTRTFRALAAP